MVKQVFEMQWKLNSYTLQNIGLDYETAINDPVTKLVWIENYRKALSAELAELVRDVREFGIGTDNGKIEVVDILHFLVSLSHIVGLEPSELPNPAKAETFFEQIVIRTFLDLDDLQNSLKWKWWAKGGGYNSKKARQAVLELWNRFNEMCILFNLDKAAVKRIYVGKNDVNFRRQAGHYNEDSKSEDDNEGLKEVIAGA